VAGAVFEEEAEEDEDNWMMRAKSGHLAA